MASPYVNKPTEFGISSRKGRAVAIYVSRTLALITTHLDYFRSRRPPVYFSRRRKMAPLPLGDAFSEKEAKHISTLRRQYVASPERYKLDISNSRLEFVRWLIAHGRLSEQCNKPSYPQNEPHRLSEQPRPTQCASVGAWGASKFAEGGAGDG